MCLIALTSQRNFQVRQEKIDLGSDKYVLRFYRPFIEADKQLLYER